MGCTSSTRMAASAPGMAGLAASDTRADLASGFVDVCWVSGLEETYPIGPCDTAENLKTAVSARHKIPLTKLRLLHGAGVLQNHVLVSQLDGQTITVVATSVHIHSANVLTEKHFGKRPNLYIGLTHMTGEQVKSKINFESPEGIAVFEGSIGVVSGPGLVARDHVTVDFPGVANVGMWLTQIERIPQHDEKDSQASTNTGVTSTATSSLGVVGVVE